MSISVTNFGEYSVKKVKSFMGREGYGFNADLHRGKTKVAFAYDDASGGEIRIDWLTGGYNGGEEGRLLKEHIATLPLVEAEIGEGRTLTIDEGWFISDCVSMYELNKDLRKMRKQCETKTLFRHSNHNYGQYGIVNCSCDDRVRAQLREQHGDVEIFNDVLANGDVPSVFE